MFTVHLSIHTNTTLYSGDFCGPNGYAVGMSEKSPSERVAWLRAYTIIHKRDFAYSTETATTTPTRMLLTVYESFQCC